MLIRLLEVDPDLGAGIEPADLPLARRAIVGIRAEASRGRWYPGNAMSGAVDPPFAALVVGGLMIRERALATAIHGEIVGPGDVVDPWTSELGILAGKVVWTAVAPVTFALLDRRFLCAVRRWPVLAMRLFERVNEQNTRISMHAAINGIRRVEHRILAILWQLADRYGKVTLDGVVIPLGLSHEAIGHLVRARRPTITLALGALCDQKLIRVETRGGFVLLEGSRAVLDPPPHVAPALLDSGIETLEPVLTGRSQRINRDHFEPRSNGRLKKEASLFRDSEDEVPPSVTAG